MPGKDNAPAIRFNYFTEVWEQREFTEITYPAGEKNRDNLVLESYSISNKSGFVPQDEQFKNGGTMQEADKSMYYIVQQNSFAYNPARINVGSIGYYDLPKNVMVSSLYEVFKTTNDVDDRFLWHWFNTDRFQHMIEQFQEGGVRLYFYYDKLCKCSILLPKVEEQKQIGQFIDKLDNLITLHQRKLLKIKNVKKAMLEKMFPKNGSSVPEVRFTGYTYAWELRKLSDIAKYRNGKAHENHISEQGNYIVINSKFVSTNGEARKFSNKQIEPLHQNEIAFVLSDVPNGRAIARTFLVEKNDKYTLNQRIAGITPLENVSPYFLYILMNRNRYFLQFDDGAKQTNLSIGDVINFEEYYPAEKEQRQIGAFFKNLDNLITLHQRKYEKLQNLKKACLEKMFV